ncbi:PREDICTED: laminin subunit alpha-3 [Gekko japonicus]|uniref:Laminin subunit alpha-3 n=1 Tax=Gekko japonicus TaxID=146911 RepID=A0ABM1KR91_GEKJA|nr:PREDICTED: laminin subunit alpha-3 [Gekko japonicus]
MAGIVLALCCCPGSAQVALPGYPEEPGLSLYPPYFNLAETAHIWATATCGQDESRRPRLELYCKLVGGPAASPAGQTIQGQFCDYCNAADPNKAHPITSAVDGTERWWQSPSLSQGLKYDEVNVTLDLGQFFHVAYILIKFANSPRPDLWVLERSVDFGRTYTPWQFFAYSKTDCWEHFGKEANVRVRKDDDVICTTEYSRIVPLENGEIVISLVNGRPGANNFTHSSALREFTKATNIRLHFLRTNTLLGHLISKAQRDPTVTRRYYYSIKDISIGGQCACNGHADVCDSKSDQSPFRYQCVCQHNTCGETCDHCCVGYNQREWQPATATSTNQCEPCNCHGHASDCYYSPEVEQRKESLSLSGHYQGGGVCIDCQHNTAGVNCERCSKGYYRPYGVPVTAPNGCIPCSCNPEHSNGCEEGSGHCYCKPNYQGKHCDQCAEGYHGFPFCDRTSVYPPATPSPEDPSAGHILGCWCSGSGVLDSSDCDRRTGQCRCRVGFQGIACDRCAVGYFHYPFCQTCQCSADGSYHDTCDSATGQCECRPGIAGQQCDRCLSAAHSFPHCLGVGSECDPAGTLDSYSGYCQCLQNVEGPGCSICKPLYWNLARENPDGCIECQCAADGTLSGVRECQQVDGSCYCKPNVCGDSCDTCEDGYYSLEGWNYFGCQGCQCDVGGSVSHVCNDHSGACQCRRHIVGKSCNEPEKNYYFPDLHHLRFEIEDGTTPSGRRIRFGYDPQEFPDFSWRGYAQMSSIQNEVRITLNVEKSNLYLFHIILRYINPGTAVVSGLISTYQSRSQTGTTQTKDVMFMPSREPVFVTVPGKSSADPFSLAPGTWIFIITAGGGVLLDYLVLLPSDYYEASILQLPVTEPCTYTRRAAIDNCLEYKHLPLDRFSCVLGSEVTFFLHGGEYRKVVFQPPTSQHPVMSHISGQEVDLNIRLNVLQVSRYVVVLEYVNEHDQVYVADVKIKDPEEVMEAKVYIYSCKYSFLCRSVVVDAMNRVAVYDLLADAKLHLHAPSLDFFLHKICIIPAESFSLEYMEPKVHCIAAYGPAPDSSASCVPSQDETPPFALVLDAQRDGKVVEAESNAVYQGSGSSSSLSSHLASGVTLTSSQNQITLSGRVTYLGRYVFIIHFYQPESPTFPVPVIVDAGHIWSGSFNASFCPHNAGCRDLVMAENQIELDIPQHEFSVMLKVPSGKILVLERLLVIPAESYSYTLLHKDTVDKSFAFINQCGGNSYHINPITSSEFCKNSARSLVAAYNDGALPCSCHRNGAMSPTCSPIGGQCSCKPNIIGRRCNKCQTGYYGFPFCKPCSCGRRLCDDVTGRCICPPQTVKPRCEVCVKQHFSYHPLAGCEACNCSNKGIVNAAYPECDKIDGQCKCRPGITGRQCDRCASGSYGFPDCRPCKCDRSGTEPDICNPETGVCLCKENVEGMQCNMCRPGSFYLDSTNPKGCTTCFCFGVTNNCRSTNKRTVKFVDMRNWHLEEMDGTDIPISFNPSSNSVVADVQELPSSVQNLYWVAPPSYLGEKLSSYGGYVSYQVKTFGLPSEGMTLLEKRPDVLLMGKQLKIIYVDPNSPSPGRQYYGSVQLVEGNFRHANTNKLVFREELMTILSRLDGLHIRGLYFTESQRLTLGEVGLEEASGTGTGNIAYNVETCSCPPQYVGDSCQECSPGFYHESKGLFAGRCVPCNCNGNANTCQDGSGTCINCQRNTVGEKCEHCKEGYFGDASQGTCRECHCPYSNSFAVGCVENGGEMQCVCREGYTGVHCESCAPGYFGNPLRYGGYCQKCNCPNNGQLSSCDRLTGECISQEPKDVERQEDCDSCDSCVITLLKDLSTMGDELHLIKSQMQSLNTNVHALEQMKNLQNRAKDLKAQLNHYRSTVKTQSTKVDELETDLIDLNQNVNALREKAEMNYRKAETLFNNFSKTNQRGKDLISKIQSVVTNVNVLLEQIAGISAEGNSLPVGDAAKDLARAQQMVTEMRNRYFGQEQLEAEKEKRRAENLLDRVRNELQKHQEKNQGLIKMIRDSLNGFESKLNDLRESLKEAKEKTKLAESLNGENKVLLDNIKKRTEDMSIQQNNIFDHLSSAEAALSQTNSVFELLQRSKEEYENLGAQFDGARKDLLEKLRSLSLAGSKTSLVVRAEEHANSLQDLARQLDELKKNASNDDLVRCAVEAASAYENIISAVKAAEAAANRAANAADSALATMDKNDLPGKARRLKTDSSNLLDRAQKAQKTLEGINPALEQVNSRVGDAQRRKNSIQGELATFQNDLQGINREEIDSMITNAKNMVQNTNEVTANVLEELEPIKTDVENIKNTYESMHSADFNAALVEANNSVTNLTNILPDLFNKITSINEQLMPIGNISENLNRIRELIQQARDAANKVAIPMRFNGSAGVEVRPPSILEDLKGYTSLSLFLQRPTSRLDTPQTSNMFVMYLGNKDSSKDYIGMAVRRSRLICAYSLGGNEAEIEVSEPVYQSEIKDAILDHVKFERIYQYAKLNYIKGATSSSSTSLGPFNSNSGSSHTLLSLDPDNVVFYVGGYPEDFIPPSTLDYPRYEGCIELDSLNERVISLYNFKRTFNLNTTEVQPCRRYTEQSAKTYFEGTGYAHVTPLPSTPSSSVRYEQTIQTTADEGLVFFAESQDDFLSLRIENGKLVIRCKVGSEPPKENRSAEVVNNGMDQPIGIVIVQKKIVLVLKSAQPLELDNVTLFRFDSYYLGGIPTSLRERFNISTPPFRGCMMNWRTSFLVRTGTFFKHGILDLSDDGFPFPNDFQVGFGFYTLALDGTLLNYNLRPDMLSVLLRNGSVIVRLADEEHQSSKKYGAGSMHYVTVMKQGDILRLLVDDVPESTIEGTFARRTSSRPIQMGGNNFEGCISNVFIQRTGRRPRVQNLTNYTQKNDVSLGSCMIKKPPQLMLLKELTDAYHLKVFKKKTPTVYLTDANKKQNSDNCPSGAPLNFVTGAYHFGNTPGTHLLFTTSKISPRDRSHFAIEVRSSLSGGLIFFMGDTLQNSYVALYLSKGRYILSVAGEDGRKIKIKSKAKYNDGQWHNVAFGIAEKRARLVIDGLRAQEGNIPRNYSASNELPIYLGGVPSLRLKNIPKKSFVGCLRNFNAGGKLMDIHHQNKGVLPCLDNTLENGVSFFNEGGHIVIENSFAMGLEYTVVFNIRPRSLTGILIHTGNKQRNFLTVYMERGTLIASGNNGAGEFSTSVTPQQPLCDGKWHTVAVTQKQNIVHLSVDTKSNYTSGPSAILSTRPAQPLYFGRVPVNLKTPWLPVQDVFLGCLKDVKINEKPHLVNKMSDIHGIVSLQGCPVN